MIEPPQGPANGIRIMPPLPDAPPEVPKNGPAWREGCCPKCSGEMNYTAGGRVCLVCGEIVPAPPEVAGMPLNIEAIRKRLATCDRGGEMNSACGEYNCDCHSEMPAALDELERLREELGWRKKPDFQSWGDVKIKNYSVETPEELLAAAQRLVAHGETLGGCGTPYGKHTGFAAQFDEIAVGEAYQKQADELATAQARLAEADKLLLGLHGNKSGWWANVKEYLSEHYPEESR